MKTAYSYVRLSSKRQTKDTSTGQTRQLEKATAVCKEKGWKLSTKTFQDLGVSGFKGLNRLQGALSEFIKLAKSGTLGQTGTIVLLLEGFDRFSRQNIDEAEPAFLDLLKCGVDIHVSLINKTFTQSHTKDLASRIEILVAIKQAHDFSALLSARIKSTQDLRDRKINSGQVIRTCNVPRYYAFDETTKTYIQTPAAEVVKRIIQLYLEGSSLYGISQALNKDKVPCIGYKKRIKWSRATIKGILQTTALYGAHKSNPTFFTDPICDKDTFDKVQVRLQQNSGMRGKFGSTFVNVFKGIIKCSDCGGSMSLGVQFFDSKSGKRKEHPYRYFRCSSVSNSQPCNNRHNFKLNDLETEFFGNFLRQDADLLTADKDTSKQTKSEITKTQIALQTVSKSISTLLDTGLDMPELKAKLNELKRQKDSLQTTLDNLVRQFGRVTAAPEHFDELKQLCGLLDDDDGWTQENVEAYSRAVNRLIDRLQDNDTRKRIRVLLPTLIGKIVVDTPNHSWKVYNHAGNVIYESLPYFG